MEERAPLITDWDRASPLIICRIIPEPQTTGMKKIARITVRPRNF